MRIRQRVISTHGKGEFDGFIYVDEDITGFSLAQLRQSVHAEIDECFKDFEYRLSNKSFKDFHQSLTGNNQAGSR